MELFIANKTVDSDLIRENNKKRSPSAVNPPLVFAPKTRSSWHINTWLGGRGSGHIKRVEIIISSRKVILGWLLAAQLDFQEIAETGKSKGLCRPLALLSQN